MRKALLLLPLVLGLVGAAHAGFKTSAPVTIIKNADGSGWFFGNLHAARNSSDSRARIYCRIHLNSASEPPYAQCGATDPNNVTMSCYSSNRDFIESIKAMTVNSHINVTVTANGDCDRLLVRNDSAYPGI